MTLIVTRNASPDVSLIRAGADSVHSACRLAVTGVTASRPLLHDRQEQNCAWLEEDSVLSREDNEILTRVGPGTLMGNLLRRYWIPACLSSEIPEADGPPARVRLLGQY